MLEFSWYAIQWLTKTERKWWKFYYFIALLVYWPNETTSRVMPAINCITVWMLNPFVGRFQTGFQYHTHMCYTSECFSFCFQSIPTFGVLINLSNKTIAGFWYSSSAPAVECFVLLIFYNRIIWYYFSDVKFTHFVVLIEPMIDSVLGITWEVSTNDKPSNQNDSSEESLASVFANRSLCHPSSVHFECRPVTQAILGNQLIWAKLNWIWINSTFCWAIITPFGWVIAGEESQQWA